MHFLKQKQKEGGSKKKKKTKKLKSESKENLADNDGDKSDTPRTVPSSGSQDLDETKGNGDRVSMTKDGDEENGEADNRNGMALQVMSGRDGEENAGKKILFY